MSVDSEMMGKLRKREIWVAGRPFIGVTSMDRAVEEQIRSYSVQGIDYNLKDVAANAGALTMTLVTDQCDTELHHMLAGRDPFVPITPLLSDPNSAIPLVVWANQRSSSNAEYIKGVYFGEWAPPAHGNETGGPADPSLPQYDGGTAVPVHIDNGFIYGKLVQMTSGSGQWTGTLPEMPIKPQDYDFYALDVIAITGTGPGPIRTHKFARGETMVGSDGVVTVQASDIVELPDDWQEDFTFAYCVLVGTGTGTWFKNTFPRVRDDYWGVVSGSGGSGTGTGTGTTGSYSSFAGIIANSVGSDVDWYNASNASGTSDGNTADVTMTVGQLSEKLFCTGFSFASLSGKTITGVTATVKRMSTPANTSQDHEIKLMVGGVVTGSSRGEVSGTDAWPGSLSDAYYGGQADLWGLGLAPANINSTFGIAINADALNTTTAEVDSVKLTIHYLPV